MVGKNLLIIPRFTSKTIMSGSLETGLFVVLALYFFIKLLIQLLDRLDRIMELLSAIFFNTNQPPTVNNNNNGVNADEVIVIEEVDEIAPIEEEPASTASIESSTSNSFSLV